MRTSLFTTTWGFARELGSYSQLCGPLRPLLRCWAEMNVILDGQHLGWKTGIYLSIYLSIYIYIYIHTHMILHDDIFWCDCVNRFWNCHLWTHARLSHFFGLPQNPMLAQAFSMDFYSSTWQIFRTSQCPGGASYLWGCYPQLLMLKKAQTSHG